MSLSKLTKYCACHEKWISWLTLVTHETLFAMRGATSVIVQLHQILRLPRKMNLMIDPWHKWNVIYNARSNMRHSPNSPNTAPATKNDRPESQRNLLKTDETSFPMRGRSDHDPSMIRPWNRQSATRLATEVTFHAHHEHFVLKNTTFRAPAIIPNFTEYCACHEKWHLNFTKYCACHAKWLSWSILFTHETLFTMRGVTSVTVQLHQILRLPRKMNLMIDPWHKPRDAYARHFLSVATFELCQAICSRFLVCSTFLVCSRFLESARVCSRENPWFVRDFRPNVREKPVKNVKIIFWKRECSRFRWPRPFVQDFGLTRAFVQHLGKVARTSKCKTKTLTNASLGMKRYLQCAEQHAS